MKIANPKINEENVKMLLLHHGKEKKLVSILRDEFCEEHAFPYLLPKFGYNAPRDIPISPSTLMKGC